MSLGDLAPYISRLHAHVAARRMRACFVLNGGQHAGTWMLSVGGGSASVLDVCTAYSAASLHEYVGNTPAQPNVSQELAVQAAGSAFRRAMRLVTAQHAETLNSVNPRSLVGVACTAALTTSRERRGSNRCFVATYQPGEVHLHKLRLHKGDNTREEEDGLVSRLVLWAYSRAVGFPADTSLLLSDAGLTCADAWADSDPSCAELSEGTVYSMRVPQASPIQLVGSRAARFAVYLQSSATRDAAGTTPTAEAGVGAGAGAGAGTGAGAAADGDSAAVHVKGDAGATHTGDHCIRGSDGCSLVPVVEPPLAPSTVVLSASFNPVHEGHLLGAAAAAAAVAATAGKDVSVLCELSVANADKPTLDADEVERRLSQFVGRSITVGSKSVPCAVAIGGEPLFVQKASLYPGAVFVVGYDTAVRIVDPKYYNHDQASLVEALVTIRAHGCTFAVLGRADSDTGAFQQLSDMQHLIPAGLSSLFVHVPGFRVDVSSTELRQKQAAEAAAAASTASAGSDSGRAQQAAVDGNGAAHDGGSKL